MADLARVEDASLGGAPRDPVEIYLAQIAPSSAETMRRCLRRIAAHFKYPSPQAIPWGQLTAGDLGALRAHLASVYAPATANLHLQAVRGVVRACWQEGLLSADARDRILSIKSIQGTRVSPGRALSEEELISLFRAAQGQPTPATASRDVALLALMVGCGLRVHEPCALLVEDILPAPGHPEQLRVRGKGNKQRLVPLPPPAAAALLEWLKHRTLLHGGPVFHPLVRNGIIRRDQGLAVSTATEALHKLGNMAGVAMSTHNFRRTVASQLFDRKVDIALIQKLLGHASPATTVRYDRRSDQALAAAVNEHIKVPYVAPLLPAAVVLDAPLLGAAVARRPRFSPAVAPPCAPPLARPALPPARARAMARRPDVQVLWSHGPAAQPRYTLSPQPHRALQVREASPAQPSS